MVADFIGFFVDTFIYDFLFYMNTWYIVPGVSFFHFLIAVALMSIIIGGVLIR